MRAPGRQRGGCDQGNTYAEARAGSNGFRRRTEGVSREKRRARRPGLPGARASDHLSNVCGWKALTCVLEVRIGLPDESTGEPIASQRMYWSHVRRGAPLGTLQASESWRRGQSRYRTWLRGKGAGDESNTHCEAVATGAFAAGTDVREAEADDRLPREIV